MFERTDAVCVETGSQNYRTFPVFSRTDYSESELEVLADRQTQLPYQKTKCGCVRNGPTHLQRITYYDTSCA